MATLFHDNGQLVGRRDTQSHIMICQGYTEYRQDLDLDNDRYLVNYFGWVIKKRLDADNEDVY